MGDFLNREANTEFQTDEKKSPNMWIFCDLNAIVLYHNRKNIQG